MKDDKKELEVIKARLNIAEDWNKINSKRIDNIMRDNLISAIVGSGVTIVNFLLIWYLYSHFHLL